MTLTSEAFAEFFTRMNPYPLRNGCRVVSASPERSCAELTIDPTLHYNALGIVHGDVYLMLADYVAACAANVDGEIRLSSTGSYEMLASAREGTLHAEAVLLRQTDRLAYHEVAIRDDAGKLLFHATMQSFRLDKKE